MKYYKVPHSIIVTKINSIIKQRVCMLKPARRCSDFKTSCFMEGLSNTISFLSFIHS